MLDTACAQLSQLSLCYRGGGTIRVDWQNNQIKFIHYTVHKCIMYSVSFGTQDIQQNKPLLSKDSVDILKRYSTLLSFQTCLTFFLSAVEHKRIFSVRTVEVNGICLVANILLLLCSAKEEKSGFGMTWGWENEDSFLLIMLLAQAYLEQSWFCSVCVEVDAGHNEKTSSGQDEFFQIASHHPLSSVKDTYALKYCTSNSKVLLVSLVAPNAIFPTCLIVFNQ